MQKFGVQNVVQPILKTNAYGIRLLANQLKPALNVIDTVILEKKNRN